MSQALFQVLALLHKPLNPHTNLCTHAQSLSRVRLLAAPWTVAHQAPLSLGFSRQKYWSGLPFPSPGDLPDPGIEPGSPALQAGSLPSEPPKKPMFQGRRHFPKTLLTRLRTADPASLCLKGPFRCVRGNKQGRLPASSGIPCWSPLS